MGSRGGQYWATPLSGFLGIRLQETRGPSTSGVLTFGLASAGASGSAPASVRRYRGNQVLSLWAGIFRSTPSGTAVPGLRSRAPVSLLGIHVGPRPPLPTSRISGALDREQVSGPRNAGDSCAPLLTTLEGAGFAHAHLTVYMPDNTGGRAAPSTQLSQ